MGIVRLTFLTIAGLGGAMMFFGSDNGLPEDRLGRARLPEPVAVVSAPVPAQEPASTPEAQVEPAVAQAPEPEPEPVAEAEPAPQPVPAAIQAPVLPMLYVTGSRVNMRSGPSISDRVVAALTRGTAVDDMGPAGEGWSHIRVIDSGLEGFMSSRFLSPDTP